MTEPKPSTFCCFLGGNFRVCSMAPSLSECREKVVIQERSIAKRPPPTLFTIHMAIQQSQFNSIWWLDGAKTSSQWPYEGAPILRNATGYSLQASVWVHQIVQRRGRLRVKVIKLATQLVEVGKEICSIRE